jgi:hypothetical protein
MPGLHPVPAPAQRAHRHSFDPRLRREVLKAMHRQHADARLEDFIEEMESHGW